MPFKPQIPFLMTLHLHGQHVLGPPQGQEWGRGPNDCQPPGFEPAPPPTWDQAGLCDQRTRQKGRWYITSETTQHSLLLGLVSISSPDYVSFSPHFPRPPAPPHSLTLPLPPPRLSRSGKTAAMLQRHSGSHWRGPCGKGLRPPSHPDSEPGHGSLLVRPQVPAAPAKSSTAPARTVWWPDAPGSAILGS